MKRLFLLPLLALAAATGCATRPATGSATVAVTRVVPSETEIPGRRLPFDPIFLRSQFDVIRSTPVLTPVVLSNDLGAVLDAAYGWHMACPDAAADRAVACLRTWTNLSIWKDSDLIGIEVSVDRAVPGAEALSRKLAGDIARSYRANAIALREAETKATAAQLQSDIDFVQKRIAESEPKDRQALESRLSKLRERLGWYGTWYGTLVPYVDVRIMDDPERPGSGTRGPGAEKWKRIVLPIVDFRQSSVVDVVAELEDLARNHDDFVAAARGQGVTFVLDVPADAVD